MNEPAFPNEGFNGWGEPFKGMTLRDYFAAKAMPLAMQMEKENTEKCIGTNWVWDGDEDNRFIVVLAYKLADQMLKTRGE